MLCKVEYPSNGCCKRKAYGVMDEKEFFPQGIFCLLSEACCCSQSNFLAWWEAKWKATAGLDYNFPTRPITPIWCLISLENVQVITTSLHVVRTLTATVSIKPLFTRESLHTANMPNINLELKRKGVLELSQHMVNPPSMLAISQHTRLVTQSPCAMKLTWEAGMVQMTSPFFDRPLRFERWQPDCWPKEMVQALVML